MKFLNFGSINIDTIFRVCHIVRPGETIPTKSIEKRAGGKGLNQSIALARVSDKVYHAGSIGIDGEFLVEEMEANNVDTSLIQKTTTPTGNAIIQVDDNGENSIVLFKGANFDNSHEYIDSVLENFESGDILVLQNEINEMPYIIDRGYNVGMKIVLNPSPITDDIKEFDYSKIDLLLLNETEAKEISGKDDLEEIKEFFKTSYPDIKIVITLGKNGAIYLDKNTEIKQDPYKVKAVDSTGAGDTFTGYFVSLFYSGSDVKEALDLATKAAALSVTKKGASVSIPHFKELKDFKGQI